MKIRSKLTIGLAVMGFTLISGALVLGISLSNYRQAQEQGVRFGEINRLGNTLHTLVTEMALRPHERVFMQWAQVGGSLGNALAEVAAPNARLAPQLEELQRRHEVFMHLYPNIHVKHETETGSERARQAILLRQLLRTSYGIAALAEEMGHEALGIARRQFENMLWASAGTFMLLSGMLIVSFLGTAGILRPVLGLSAALEDLQNDRAHDLDTERKDEIGDLTRALVMAQQRIQRSEAEQRRTNRHLTRTNTDLARSNSELESFAYAASHDLRAPLRAIHALAEWVVEDMDNNELDEVRGHLKDMTQQAERMDRMLSDLLEYSRVGRIDMKVETISLNDVIDETLALTQPPASFRIERPTQDLRFKAIPTEISVILRNLIGNAVKHHDQESGRITISSGREDGNVVIAVTDDGPGIPERHHERVFDMFTTLRSRDEVEGSGLGLALVSKIVEHHGGTIEVLSEEGVRGTTFKVTLPDLENAPAVEPMEEQALAES